MPIPFRSHSGASPITSSIMTEPDIPGLVEPLPCPAFTNKHPESSPEEPWKHLPPYDVQSKDFGPIKWRGTCLCGRVSYALNREKPLNAKYCHCRGCQVAHGAPFQWAAIFHKSDMTFTNGAHGLVFYSSTHHSQDHELPTKVYCANCRTPIMDEGRNMCMVFPSLIELEGSCDEQREKRSLFQPTYVPSTVCDGRQLILPDATYFTSPGS